MKKAMIYIHGKGGNAEECLHYAPLFPGYEILGFDYHAETPWEEETEFRDYFAACAGRYDAFSVIANSIGAYFYLLSMGGAVQKLPEAVFLISPVVDMERLISDMMLWAGVDEARLQAEGEIPTDFGEVLSWEYLSYVRAHPIRRDGGRVPTAVLWGTSDHLVPEDVIRDFAERSGAELTVCPGGEHWFHTEEQMAFLDRWMIGFRMRFGHLCEITTDRLRLYPASEDETARFLSAQKALGAPGELLTAYTEMRDGAISHPAQWVWYTIWMIELTDGTHVGDLCFKGLDETGCTEIGYGIDESFQRHGYAAEAVTAAVDWALMQPGVNLVTAQTEDGSAASQRVLAKAGFLPTGTRGEEGPLFAKRK